MHLSLGRFLLCLTGLSGPRIAVPAPPSASRLPHPAGIPLIIVAVILAGPAGRAESEFSLQDGSRVTIVGPGFTGRELIVPLLETYVRTRFPERNISFTVALSCAEVAAEPADSASSHMVVLPAAGAGADVAVTQAEGCLAAGSRDPRHPSRIIFLMPASTASISRDTMLRLHSANGVSIMQLGPGPATGDAATDLATVVGVLMNWNAPAAVTSVAVDAITGRVQEQVNTTLRTVEADRVVGWTQADAALMLPLQVEDLAPQQKSVAAIAEMFNRQVVRVHGLRAPQYRFTIDGEMMGTVSSDELDRGINVSLLRSPMAKQAAEVYDCARQLFEARVALARQQQTPAESRSAAWRQEAARLTQLVADLQVQQAIGAKPRLHDYEFQPVEP